MLNNNITFSQVAWKPTVSLNCLRAIFAGAVITIFEVLSGDLPLSRAMMYFVEAPMVYVVGAIPLWLLTNWLLERPFIRNVTFPVWATIVFMRFFATLFVILGDPFVFLLHKIRPQLVIIPEQFKILNRELVIFILKPTEKTISKELQELRDSSNPNKFPRSFGYGTEDEKCQEPRLSIEPTMNRPDVIHHHTVPLIPEWESMDKRVSFYIHNFSDQPH